VRARHRGTRKIRPQETGAISTDVSDAAPWGAPRRPEARWEQRSREREEASVAAQSLVNQMIRHLGGIEDALKAPPRSDVLFSGMVVITDVSGVWLGHGWPIPFQSLRIANSSAQLLTVSNHGANATVPTRGAGVWQVPPLCDMTFDLRGAQLTIYGVQNVSFGMTVYSRRRDPASATIPAP
jgi:hypothetical protein